MMPAFSHHQSSQDQNFRNPTNETELNLYGSEKEMIQRRIYLWTEANKQAQGAYRDEITKWREALHKNALATDQVMSAVYGVGAAQARKRGPREAVQTPLPQDRPWARPGAASASRTARQRPSQRYAQETTELARRYTTGDLSEIVSRQPSRSRSESLLRLRGGAPERWTDSSEEREAEQRKKEHRNAEGSVHR